MHLVRHHLKNNVCPHCEANTTTRPFEDVQATAAWIPTIGKSNPWNKPPVFAALPGGDVATFIKLDTFHLGPLGAGYYLAASILCLLVAEFKHFQPSDGRLDVESRLNVAHGWFLDWCALHHKSPRDLKDFTKSNLHWPDQASFPMFSGKAGDTTLVLGWLEDYLTSLPLNMAADRLLELCVECVTSFNQFWRLLYTSQDRVWWTENEATAGLASLTTFLRTYQASALLCHRRTLAQD